MKTVKSLLLGSATALVAFTGAQAADLPVAEPVEYVKVCSTYGDGFFYIPGTNTCLKIGGLARTDLYVTGNTDKRDNEDSTRWDIRGRLNADARSETEWGTLRSFIELEGRVDPSDNENNRAVMRFGFVQFSGLTVGFASSFYDFLEYSFVNDIFSDERVAQAAYTAAFGNGFSATIAVENRGDREVGFSQDDLYGSQTWPNAVAALRIDQAWGSAQLSGALQQNRPNADFAGDTDSKLAWAAQAGVSVNLPFFGTEGSNVWVQGAYTQGALSYIGAEDAFGNKATGKLDNDDFLIGDFAVDADGQIRQTEAYAVGGGFNLQWSPTVVTGVAGYYAHLDQKDGNPNAKFYQALLNTTWTPVKGLSLGLEGSYTQLDVAGSAPNDHVWGGIARVARKF